MTLHYIFGGNTKEVIYTLENSSKDILQWFSNNQMKANADKCHLLTSSNETPTICTTTANKNSFQPLTALQKLDPAANQKA